MRDNCAADLYSSAELIIRHVFWDLRNMSDDFQTSFLDHQAPFLGLPGIFFVATFLGSCAYILSNLIVIVFEQI